MDITWVQATNVIKERLGYVTVIINSETFKNCRLQGRESPDYDNSVVVQNKQGDWLKVWFYDKDVV